MASALLPPPPSYEKGKHPDDLLSDGGALEARAVASAARRFFGGKRVELFGPALLYAVRTPWGYLSSAGAGDDGRVSCNGVDPAAPACAWILQKGGVAAHFRLTFKSVTTHRRLRVEPGTSTISATGGQGDGEAPDDERFMYHNYEKEPPGAFPGDSMTFSGSRNVELMLCAETPDRLCLGASGTAFYLVDPVTEQARVDALRRALRDKQTAVALAPAPAPEQPPGPPAPPTEAAQRGLRAQLLQALQRSGAAARVEQLLAESPVSVALSRAALRALLDAPDDEGRALLHHATVGGDAGCVRALLAHGAAPAVRDADGDTPLHLAALEGNAEAAAALVKRDGGAVHIINASRATPLHYAASGGDANTMLVLLTAGAARDARDSEGETPLHAAARYGRRLAARTLLDDDGATEDAFAASRRALLSARCAVGCTPLHVAAAEGRSKLATLLLECGADATALNESGMSSLECAVASGNLQVAMLIAEHLQAAAAAAEGDGGAISSSSEYEDDDWATAAATGDDASETAAAEEESSSESTEAEEEEEQEKSCVFLGSDAANTDQTVSVFGAALAAATVSAASEPSSAAVTSAAGPAVMWPAPPKAKGQQQANKKGAPAGAKLKADAVNAPAKAAKLPKEAAAAAAAPNLYKTILCRHFAQGDVCAHGSACKFAHGEAELRRPRPPKGGGGANKKAPKAPGAGAAKPGGNAPKPAGAASKAAAVSKRQAKEAAAAVAAAAAAVAAKPSGAAKAVKAGAKLPAGVPASKATKSGAAVADAFTPLPFPDQGAAGPIGAFHAHGETLAEAYMRWLGFLDAKKGKFNKPDGGLDVRSRGALAQCKANANSQSTDRQMLSKLFGDASAEPDTSGGSRRLLFFAMRAFTEDALKFAEQPQIRMCLFIMHRAGNVEAVNVHARELLSARLNSNGGGKSKEREPGAPAGPMRTWSRDSVQAWLCARALEQYAHNALFRPLTGADLVELGDDDLSELGVSITQHRRIILRGIAEYAA